MVHDDRSFDYHDADFVLFGVTAEEIRWLQRDSSSSSTTPKPPSTGETRTSFTNSPVWCTVSEVCAPVVLWAFTDLCRLWALAQQGSGMFLAVHGATCASPPDSSTWTRPPRLPCAPASTASFSLTIERRFMRRVAHRVRPCESGCPIHKKQLLPVLVVWAPPRKKRNQEHHALNGNTSPSAGYPPRSARQRVDLANDDDLEPTLVLPVTAPGAAADWPGRPRADLQALLERLLTRGRELAGTITRLEVDTLEMGIVAPPKRTDGTS